MGGLLAFKGHLVATRAFIGSTVAIRTVVFTTGAIVAAVSFVVLITAMASKITRITSVSVLVLVPPPHPLERSRCPVHLLLSQEEERVSLLLFLYLRSFRTPFLFLRAMRSVSTLSCFSAYLPRNTASTRSYVLGVNNIEQSRPVWRQASTVDRNRR